ncbi:DUF6314 family protein [Poseidonocella sp. HB161398]|uniref:DUF6314 family protein n=1 Tax=Poseidonocella sp. HB161398 TaxID=2320855 RepID=UPI001107DFC5|nr:DUF6314 family protein [Poseidonocella sp. HB161398]
MAPRPYGEAAPGASLPAAERLFTAAGLAGTWAVTRQIADARTGGTARLEGLARFHPDDGGLRYDEEGVLTLPGGQSFAATRRYLWRFGPPVRVLFADGRLFHVLDPADPEAELVHHCGDDLYRGRYRAGAAFWETEWHVTGPRKDQVSRIRYRRTGTSEIS